MAICQARAAGIEHHAKTARRAPGAPGRYAAWAPGFPRRWVLAHATHASSGHANYHAQLTGALQTAAANQKTNKKRRCAAYKAAVLLPRQPSLHTHLRSAHLFRSY